jgi:hypothetical protein
MRSNQVVSLDAPARHVAGRAVAFGKALAAAGRGEDRGEKRDVDEVY